MRGTRLYTALGALIVVFSGGRARAEAGPPMVLDDPGTPGPNGWEIDIAATSEATPLSRNSEFPLLDVNYGLGESLQFTVEAPWSEVQESNSATVHQGFDRWTTGVKWRFLNQDTDGVSMAVYPQFVSVGPDANHTGNADVEQEFYLPFNLEEGEGRFAFNQELGFRLTGTSEKSLEAGVSTAFHVREDLLSLLVELHDTMAMGGQKDHEVLANAGAIYSLTKVSNLLISVGHSLLTPPSKAPRSIAYFGTQFHF